MKGYLENMELYDYAITLTDALPIESSSGPDCEKLSDVKKVMDLQYFDISPEQKKTVKSLVRKCMNEGLLPTSDEERYEPIKDFLNENTSPSYQDMMEDEDVKDNFEALEKLTEAECDAILGDAVNGYKDLTLKNFLVELTKMPAVSPELKALFEKNSELLTKSLDSPDLELVAYTVQVFSHFLLKNNAEYVLNLEVLPRIVSFLSDQFNTRSDLELDVVFYATWALSNITSGTPEQTACVVDAGAVPLLVAKVLDPRSDIRLRALWTLNNIAADSVKFRDMILDTKLPENLLNVLQTEQNSTTIDLDLIRTASWGLLVLTDIIRGNCPKWAKISSTIPIISVLLKFDDEKMLLEVAEALSTMVKNPDMVTSEMKCLVKEINDVIEKTTNPEIKALLTAVASKIGSTN